jgi:hypothetical protein
MRKLLLNTPQAMHLYPIRLSFFFWGGKFLTVKEYSVTSNKMNGFAHDEVSDIQTVRDHSHLLNIF